jgi:phosphatidylserine/phosphatidylglycerophosphate/cardiolipin synthase-like enzyme
MKPVILFLFVLLTYSFNVIAIGETLASEVSENIKLEVKLVLKTVTASGEPKGTDAIVLIKNLEKDQVKIQNPKNRFAITFYVINALGNSVAPDFIGKIDPPFSEISLKSDEQTQVEFPGVKFATGTAFVNFKFKAGESYRVVAVYRPGGLKGPGIASREVIYNTSLPQRKPDSFSQIQEEDGDPALTTHSIAEQKINWVDSDLSKLGGPFVNSETPTVTEIIGLARQSLDIEIYQMADPGVRSALRKALAKANPVRVRVIKEPNSIGETCDVFAQGGLKKATASTKGPAQEDCLDQQALTREILRGGGAFVPFNKEQLCGQNQKKGPCFQHGKLIIVDKNRFALISTGNFNASNLCDIVYDPKNCNRDYTYITRDPEVISALNEIFENDLKGQRYDLKAILINHKVHDKITVSPFAYDPLKDFLLSAQTSIQIQNQYINPDSGIPEVLLQKAKEWSLADKPNSNRKIEVLLTDVCFFGKISEKKAFQLHLMFSAMEAEGIQVRMFTKDHKIGNRPGYLHAKAIVVDKQRGWIGSVNGSSSSLNQNREFGIFFSHPSRIEQLSLFLDTDFQHSSNETWRDSLLCHNTSYLAKAAIRTPEDASYAQKIKLISKNQINAKNQIPVELEDEDD